MSTLLHVALLGFSAFERNALASHFRLATSRVPRYEVAQILSDADLMVADADHTPSVELVAAIERLDDTVFVGARPPSRARVCLSRPIEPIAVMRELDALLAARGTDGARSRPPGAPRPAVEPPPPASPARGPEGEDLPPLDLQLRSEPAPIRAPASPPSAAPQRAASDRALRPGPLAAALSTFPPLSPTDFPPIVPPAVPPAAAAPVVPVNPVTPVAPLTAVYPPLAPQVIAALADPVAPSWPPAPASRAAATAEPLAGQAAAPSKSPASGPDAVAGPTLTPVAKSEPVKAPAPASRLSLTGTARATAARRPIGATTSTPPIRALVVDDSEIAQRFLQLRLERFGLLVDSAASSEVALSLLTRHSYDFAFLDVELGESSRLDGLALCQAVKRHYATRVPPITVVLVTAHTGELDRVRGTLAGCDAFLGKPLDEAGLDRLLARHGLVRRPPAQPA